LVLADAVLDVLDAPDVINEEGAVDDEVPEGGRDPTVDLAVHATKTLWPEALVCVMAPT
jgi:hypothetical protein